MPITEPMTLTPAHMKDFRPKEPRKPEDTKVLREPVPSGKSVEQILVEIAKESDLMINSYTTRAALMNTGVLQGTKREAGQKLYSILKRSARFVQREGQKGRWILVPEWLQANGPQ